MTISAAAVHAEARRATTAPGACYERLVWAAIFHAVGSVIGTRVGARVTRNSAFESLLIDNHRRTAGQVVTGIEGSGYICGLAIGEVVPGSQCVGDETGR